MSHVPYVSSLQEAVDVVIRSNSAMGYVPTRFIQVTQHGYAPDLLAVCIRLIESPDTLNSLTHNVRPMPTLLTLEDFVARYGEAWGFPVSTIVEAEARVHLFDALFGRP